MTDEANPKHYLETSIFRNGKESEQEVAFENVNNLTLIQKFYYGQIFVLIGLILTTCIAYC
ncbi:hypothetical protein V1478_001645 [Vespula squamosa]|uniref:Uncharacterized protein n=1 Tax=Vespula squamosa TaxID=30214 RepID=A0ABD2BVQ3_VESSQ